MEKNRLNLLRKILLRFGILLGIGLLLIQILNVYESLANQTLILRHIWPFIVAIAIVIINIFIQIEAWIIMMQALNVDMPHHEARRGYVLSFFARYIPGSVWGYISRSEWLWQKYQVTYKQSNYVSILEILLDLFSSLLAIGICMVLLIIDKIYIIPIILVIILLIIIWIALPSQLLPFATRLFPSVYQENFPRLKLQSHKWVLPIILRLMNWFIYGFTLFLIGLAFETWQTDQFISHWIQLTKDYCLAWLSGYVIIFLPSGLGVRELVLSSQLTNHFHLDPGVAMGISVIMRFVIMIAEFACVPLLYLLKQIFVRNNIQSQDSSNNKQIGLP